jgi:hypothetical protein
MNVKAAWLLVIVWLCMCLHAAAGLWCWREGCTLFAIASGGRSVGFVCSSCRKYPICTHGPSSMIINCLDCGGPIRLGLWSVHQHKQKCVADVCPAVLLCCRSAGAMVFLSSHAADYITGTTLVVDGGGTSRAMAK